MNKKVRNISLGVVGALVVATATYKAIPHLVLQQNEVTAIDHGSVTIKGEIPIKQGEVLVAQTTTKQLYLDTDTLDIRVVDKQTSNQWNSKIEVPTTTKDKSVVNISYVTKEDQIQEWDAYTAAIEPGNYTINEIENGFRMNLYMESTTKQANQLLPSFISEEDIKTKFYDVIDQQETAGALTESDAKMYRAVLKQVYMLDTVAGGYKVTELSPSGLKQLNKMVKAIGYTEEMVLEDNDKAGIDVEIPPAPSFTVVVDVTLDDEDLVVNVPSYECTSGNDYYTLQGIDVYSGFGHASSEDVEDGYILVPDGSGALLELNSYNSAYPVYERPVYNNKIYSDMYEMSDYSENLHMPVFGMAYGNKDEMTHGFMGIIESGAELASIYAEVGTKDMTSGGSLNNRVYPSVDLMQYSRVKLMGPYSDDETRYLASTGPIDFDYTVRYKFFNEEASYYEMAATYQDYLMEKHQLEKSFANTPKLHLDILGALTVEERFVGVPYNKTISMTTYTQAKEMLEELDSMNIVANYNGAFFGGDETKVPSNTNLVKENGSEKELNDLLAYGNTETDQLFLGTDLMTIKNTQYPFSSKVHGAYNFDSKPIEMYGYNYSTGEFSPQTSPEYIMHPKYFNDVVKTFIEGTNEYSNVYLNDVPNTYFASYNAQEILTPVDANHMIEQELAVLDEAKTVACNNPNMNTVPYCNYASNVSRESSEYGAFSESVPFRQLVLNGLMEYTTLNANMSAQSLDYYVLQALEVGSYPKFTVSATNQDILKNSEHRHYSSIDYTVLKPKIEEVYQKYTDAYDQIGTQEIVNHQVLAENVFETEYANGVNVITNYNAYGVNVNGHQIDAVGFKIIK